jgi:hypothetical protein
LADASEPVAIVDASPLILLGRIERLDLLRLAGRVFVPQDVLDEVGVKDADRHLGREIAARSWLGRIPPVEPSLEARRLTARGISEFSEFEIGLEVKGVDFGGEGSVGNA